jgi:hypothetical protein
MRENNIPQMIEDRPERVVNLLAFDSGTTDYCRNKLTVGLGKHSVDCAIAMYYKNIQSTVLHNSTNNRRHRLGLLRKCFACLFLPLLIY